MAHHVVRVVRSLIVRRVDVACGTLHREQQSRLLPRAKKQKIRPIQRIGHVRACVCKTRPPHFLATDFARCQAKCRSAGIRVMKSATVGAVSRPPRPPHRGPLRICAGESRRGSYLGAEQHMSRSQLYHVLSRSPPGTALPRYYFNYISLSPPPPPNATIQALTEITTNLS